MGRVHGLGTASAEVSPSPHPGLTLARTLARTSPSLSPDPYLTLSSAQRARVPCSVFSDGLMLRRGPFRPWSEAAPFVREAMAGYLPYELKQARPDALPEPKPQP